MTIRAPLLVKPQGFPRPFYVTPPRDTRDHDDHEADEIERELADRIASLPYPSRRRVLRRFAPVDDLR